MARMKGMTGAGSAMFQMDIRPIVTMIKGYEAVLGKRGGIGDWRPELRAWLDAAGPEIKNNFVTGSAAGKPWTPVQSESMRERSNPARRNKKNPPLSDWMKVRPDDPAIEKRFNKRLKKDAALQTALKDVTAINRRIASYQKEIDAAKRHFDKRRKAVRDREARQAKILAKGKAGKATQREMRSAINNARRFGEPERYNLNDKTRVVKDGEKLLENATTTDTHSWEKDNDIDAGSRNLHKRIDSLQKLMRKERASLNDSTGVMRGERNISDSTLGGGGGGTSDVQYTSRGAKGRVDDEMAKHNKGLRSASHRSGRIWRGLMEAASNVSEGKYSEVSALRVGFNTAAFGVKPDKMPQGKSLQENWKGRPARIWAALPEHTTKYLKELVEDGIKARLNGYPDYRGSFTKRGVKGGRSTG